MERLSHDDGIDRRVDERDRLSRARERMGRRRTGHELDEHGGDRFHRNHPRSGRLKQARELPRPGAEVEHRPLWSDVECLETNAAASGG